MSGTAFGTIVLHVAPEANVGGPISIVETGDRIQIDVSQGLLELLVPESEIEKRLKSRKQPKENYTRGYAKLYIDNVMQADKGADLDFLVGKDTRLPSRESH
jgi:dihydroxy-acid dehydratase